MESRKGKECLFKPITCQEGYCNDCQIALEVGEESMDMAEIMWDMERKGLVKVGRKIVITGKAREVFAQIKAEAHRLRLLVTVPYPSGEEFIQDVEAEIAEKMRN